MASDTHVKSTLLSTAELGMHNALSKPRATFRVSKALASSCIPTNADGSPLALSELATLRVDKNLEHKRKQAEEVDAVKSLHHQPIQPAQSSTGFARIAESNNRRKHRHDEAVALWRNKRQACYDRIEDEVVVCGRALREALQTRELAVEEIFSGLTEDMDIMKLGYDEVINVWSKVDSISQELQEAINGMASELSQMEDNRANTMKHFLKELVRQLMDIAAQLPGNIERFVEKEALEVNRVVLANRRSFALLIAKLKSERANKHYNWLRRWEDVLARWRRVRHDGALQAITERLQSDEFVNPPARVKLLRELVQAQQQRHEKKRLPLLEQLRHLIPPTLTSQAVAAVRASFDELASDETADNTTRYHALKAQHEAMIEFGSTLCEHLRDELHEYAALAREGEFEEFISAIGNCVRSEDENMQQFFRESGGLKSKFTDMLKRLADRPQLYRDTSSLKRDLRLLLACADMSEILEAAGKDSDRTRARDTVNQMRTAKRNMLPDLLPKLASELLALSEVEGVPDLCKQEFVDTATQLNELYAAAKKAEEDDKRSKASGTIRGDGMSVGSRKSAITSRSKRTNRTASTALSAGSVVTGAAAALDMAQTRALQRHAGMLLSVTMLSPDLKAAISVGLTEIEAQATSNELIDKAVEETTATLIQTRNEEREEFLQRIGLVLEEQADALSHGGDELCNFYSELAKHIEEHQTRESKLDEWIDQELLGALDDFDEAESQHEMEVKHLQQQLRHSPNDGELAKRFEAVLQKLRGIEEFYRHYHTSACELNGQYPRRVARNIREYRRKLIASFDLVFPNAAQHDGEPEDGELPPPPAPPTPPATTEPVAEQTEEDAAEEAPPQELSDDERYADLPSLVTAASTVYKVQMSIEERWQQRLAPSNDSDSQNEAKEELQPDGESTEPSLAPDTKADAEEGVSEEEKAESVHTPPPPTHDSRGMPLDPSGEPCLEPVLMPVPAIVEILTDLRNCMLEQWDNEVQSRRSSVAAVTEQRIQDLTEELEERLRRHWPRKGKAEVELRQPRETELVAHRQKFDRHVRKLRERMQSISVDYQTDLTNASATVHKFSVQQQALQSILPAQTTLAALQGVQAKHKRLLDSFEADCSSSVQQLSVHLTESVQRFKQLNQDFLRTCSLFTEGGEYDEEEVASAQAGLLAVEQELSAETDERNEQLTALQAEADKIRQQFAGFKAAYEEALKSLSMREGLGKKYGAPRRKVQERVRTALSYSGMSEEEIDAKLAELRQLVDATAGEEVDVARPAVRVGATHLPRQLEQSEYVSTLAGRIKLVLMELRNMVYFRALFLEALRDDVRSVSLETMSLDDDCSTPVAAIADQAPPSLMKVLADAATACKADTIELFEQEGVTITEDSLPQSLVTYLSEQQEEVAAKRTDSTRRLREQIEEMHAVAADAPSAVLEDITARAFVASDIEAKRVRKAFRKQYKQLSTQRSEHKATLTPAYGDPNNAGQLQELCTAEDTRVQSTLNVIRTAYADTVTARVQCAQAFQSRLLTNTEMLLRFCNNVLMYEDMVPLPGDESNVRPKMSLKRKRKQLRKQRAEQSTIVEDEEAGGEGQTTAAIAAPEGIKTRVWEGLEKGHIRLNSHPDWAADLEIPQPSDSEGISSAIPTLYTSIARHTIRTRNAEHERYVEMFKEAIAHVQGKFTEYYESEMEWQRNWNSMIERLQTAFKE